MTQAEILQQLRSMTTAQRLAVAQVALQLVREESEKQLLSREERRQQLVAAAELLRSDYESDSELTAFIALDAEDFYGE